MPVTLNDLAKYRISSIKYSPTKVQGVLLYSKRFQITREHLANIILDLERRQGVAVDRNVHLLKITRIKQINTFHHKK